MASSSRSGPSTPKVARVEVNSGLESEDGMQEEFDPDCQIALEEIDKYQTEVDGLNDQASEEILKVEQKFNTLRKPLYNKRADVIRKIPNFWVTAMVNHPQISVLINEDEEDCLQHLQALEVEEFEDIKSGYRIKFNFEKNAFFENDVLVKELHMGNEDDAVSTSTEIRWKENMNLCKQHQDVTNAGTRKRHLEQKSFFSWFTDHSDPVGDEIAEIIKDELWPNPLQYYLVPDGVEGSETEEASEEEEEEEGFNGTSVEEDELDYDSEEEGFVQGGGDQNNPKDDDVKGDGNKG